MNKREERLLFLAAGVSSKLDDIWWAFMPRACSPEYWASASDLANSRFHNLRRMIGIYCWRTVCPDH